MKKLISTSNITIEGFETVLTTDLNQSAKEFVNEENSAKNLYVNVNNYEEARIAIFHKAKLIVDGNLVKQSEIKDFFSRSLFLFNMAKTAEEVQSASHDLLEASMKNCPVKMSEDTLFSILSTYCKEDNKKDFPSLVKGEMEYRKEQVKKLISFTGVINAKNSNYKDGTTLKQLSKNGVHLITGTTGSNKTTMMLEYFQQEVSRGNFPMLVNSSRALSEALSANNADMFYKSILENTTFNYMTQSIETELKAGSIGVINSMFLSNDLTRQRKQTKTLIIDEIDEVLNHISGGAIGNGDLASQKKAFEVLIEMFAQCDKIVLIDAMMSQNTVDIIKSIIEFNGQDKKITNHYAKSEFKKPKLKVLSQKMNIATASDLIASGSKMGVFNDGAHNEVKSELNGLVNALKDNKKHSLIDGNFMANRDEAGKLKDLESFSKANDIIFYNSAAKCGLSVMDPEYKTVSLFSNKTVSPNELVQAAARFRLAQTVYVSFKGMQRDNHTNKFAIMTSIMFKEIAASGVTQDKLNEMMADRLADLVVSRIAHKNQMMNDYDNTALIIFEEMGYEIEYVERVEEQEAKGSDIHKQGNQEEQSVRIGSVCKAERINEKEAQELNKNKGYLSSEDKAKLEAYNLTEAYGVDQVTEDLMVFDNAGKGRQLMKNLEFARTAEFARQTKAANIAKFRILDVLTINLGFDFNNINEFTFTKSDADVFQNLLTTEEVVIGNMKMKASDALELAFDNVQILKTSTKTLTAFLKAVFGVKATNTKKRTKGEYIYSVEINETLENLYINKHGKLEQVQAA